VKSSRILALTGALALLVPFLPSEQAAAGTATANLSVSTSITSSCSIGAASLSFPAYTGALDTASTSVTVTCNVSTGLAPYITLNTNTLGQRNMTNGAATLPYELCEDAACATPITSTTHYAVNYSTSGTGNSIYGEIPASETASSSGSFNDTVTMTLNF